MSKLEVPSFPESWTNADLLTWINSKTETAKDLLEAVDAKINTTQKRMIETKSEIERMKEEENVLEACGRLCFELRDRLKMVVDAQAKEQLAKEFDAIAIFDKADSRAAEVAKIIMARKTWTDSVNVIESLEDGEPAPENVVFALQEAHATLSNYLTVNERGEYLEKVKDIFLSWYSTRVVLALQSESPADSLLSIKNKYDMLKRTEDFNAVIRHYIKDQSKLDLHPAQTLPDLFINVQNSIVSNFTRLREGQGWAEKVLDSPSQFIAKALTESIISQWDQVKEVCSDTLGRTMEEDLSGALSLRMCLALRQLISDVAPQTDDDKPLSECILDFGLRLLADVSSDYSKLASSFLATHSNISVGSGTAANNLEQLSNGLTHLIKESSYLMQITNETYDNLAVIFVIPAFRSMYENLISLFAKFYKTYMEKSTVKDNDILRLIGLSGQMISWMESDRIKLKHMLEDYQKRGAKSFMSRIAEKLANDISNFEKKINVKSDGDLGIAKACSEFKKLNKRFVSRAVELLTRPLITEMETALKNLRTEKAETSEIKTSEVEVPSFGTTPNEFVTAAGVALLSLAHQLSAYSHDSNMAASLASASKIDIVDDVTSWWVEKCAAAVQDCFIDGIGEVRELPVPFARQFAVDYAYLADVFEDLGTPRIVEFIEMRKTFMDLGYISA